ncbi:MAG TPA: hypothetical protein DIW31_09165 [Bacteroidales bacterium]|nr:hypothetical protein [Bacteroidales bacterium]
MIRSNKYFLLLMLTLLISVSVSAQKLNKLDSLYAGIQERKANKYFQYTAYVRAIHLYKELANKGYKNDSLIRNLAIAYYKVSDTKNAEDFLRMIIDEGRYTQEELYFYIQSLKYNGKYEEADLWLEKYLQVNANDKRALEQKGTTDFIKKLKEKERYKIEEVPFNSENSDFGAVPYEGKILFASARNDQAIIRFQDSWKNTPFFALYSIANDNASAIRVQPFGKKFNTLYHDGPVCFDTTETEVFITRNTFKHRIPRKGKEGVNNLKILYAKKNTLGVWGSLKNMKFNSRDYSCGHPSLSPDGKTLYFASNMPGGYGATDIYYVTRTEDGWSDPVNMGAEINTSSDDMFPFIHSNGHLYFASSGRQGMGGLDLFEAFKKNDGTYAVLNMGYPINSNNDDFGIYLAPDGVHGYFASNRPGGKGDDDIYRFIVTNPMRLALDLEGDVTDAMDGHKLDSSNVVLTLADGSNPQTLNTGALNTFSYEIKPDLKYKITVTRNGYSSAIIDIDPDKRPENSGLVKVPITLERVQEWGIYGNVYIRGSKEVVPKVEINIKHIAGDNYTTLITPEVEGFKVKLEPNTAYEISFEKKGFLTTKGSYSTVGQKPGYVDINEFIDVSIEKIDMDKTIEVNIYYDLGKWNIRKDAVIELDKVVAFLNDNPDIKIELGSHTDARGDAISNQALSQKRADSAVAYIISKGISNDRIVAKGYGESKLKNQCADGVKCTEEEHQQNRRTEIRITSF